MRLRAHLSRGWFVPGYGVSLIHSFLAQTIIKPNRPPCDSKHSSGGEPMGTTRAALTDSDIRMLVKGATPDERALAAHKLCRNIDRAVLSDEERQGAHDILRVMAADAAELVGRPMAVTLKNPTALPADVANRLARDVESVSLPI